KEAEYCLILYNFSLNPGHSVEVEGFIPKVCKVYSIKLVKDDNNLVLHFNPRFSHINGDKQKIILNSMEDGVGGAKQKESFFPFQEESDTTVSSLSKTRSPYNYLLEILSHFQSASP
ncbi:unnamed protein product, partial [Staurois parvus]